MTQKARLLKKKNRKTQKPITISDDNVEGSIGIKKTLGFHSKSSPLLYKPIYSPQLQHDLPSLSMYQKLGFHCCFPFYIKPTTYWPQFSSSLHCPALLFSQITHRPPSFITHLLLSYHSFCLFYLYFI